MKLKYVVKDDDANVYKLEDFEQVDQKKLVEFDSLTDSEEDGDVIYNIATVSDKEINCRIYPDQHIRDTVIQKKWLNPFLKPLLLNHDIYTEPLGRIVDSFYVEHNTLDVLGGSEKLPDSVVMKFKKEGHLEDGSGSVILKIKPFKDTLAKIKDGVMLTTSQASATDSLTCSICGKDYYDCEHRIGGVYDGKKALLKTGSLSPYENSSVNRPANDSSVFLRYSKNEDKSYIYGTDNDNVLVSSTESKKDEETEDNVKNLPEDTKDTKLVEETLDKKEGVKMKEKIAAQLKKLKERTLKDLSKTFSLDEEKKQKFSTVLDSFSEDDTFTVLDFVELIENEISDMIIEKENLSQEIADLKNKMIILESADTLEPSADSDSHEDEEANEDAESEDEKTEADADAKDDKAVVAEEEKTEDSTEIEEGKKEVEDSTNTEEDVKTDVVPENVPDFLNKKNEIEDKKETKEVKKTNSQLQGIFNPKKMFE